MHLKIHQWKHLEWNRKKTKGGKPREKEWLKTALCLKKNVDFMRRGEPERDRNSIWRLNSQEFSKTEKGN